MKTKLLGVVATLIFAATIGFNVKMNSKEKNQLTDFCLANVEALASESSNVQYWSSAETASCTLQLGGGMFTGSVERVCRKSYSPCVCTPVACGDTFYNY